MNLNKITIDNQHYDDVVFYGDHVYCKVCMRSYDTTYINRHRTSKTHQDNIHRVHLDEDYLNKCNAFLKVKEDDRKFRVGKYWENRRR